MIPKKATDLAREYATQHGIPEEHAVHMLQSAFQILKDLMGTYDHNMIYMPYLGTFFFRVWKIEEHVKKCNAILRQGVLPVSVLDTIQDQRQNLIKMDAIILEEMGRRSDQRTDKRENGVHNQNTYIRGECRCAVCKADHCKVMKKYYRTKKEKKAREDHRQNLIKQQHETEGQAPEDMGE